MFQTSASCPPELRLSTFFDPSQPRASYGDADIEEVRLLLSRCPHHRYASAAPRTYIILRYIDQLQILRRLLEEDFGDSWFPIGKRSLPSFLGPRIKAAIVEHQHIIFTKSLDLETGTHCTLDLAEEPPFIFVSYIGNGSFGQVSRIRSKVTYKDYALKTIRRQARYGTEARHVMERFLSEMKIMKRLTHQHIVQYVGSFTDKHDLGLVMSPIADCDLAAYLCNVCTRREHHPTLQTFYGCLATALAYLHDHRIKHRDIKPHNILVHRASVLLTDFGLSHESLDSSSGPRSGTTRYQSPEMAASDNRNESTDIWSLGCVFLEMMTALCGHDVDWLKSYYEQSGTCSTHFHANLEATQHLLSGWSTTILPKYAKPLIWIRDMLVSDRSTRPTAEHIAGQITAPGDRSRFTYSCRRCCDDGSDSDLKPARIRDASSLTTPRTNQVTRRRANASLCVSAFSQPLSKINRSTECHINHVGFPCGGTMYIYSRPVPTVLGKCIEHILITEGKRFQGCLMQQPCAGSDYMERCAQLKKEFNTAPDYGKGIEWGRYTLFECASVLIEYIATIPRLLGWERAKTKRYGPKLSSEQGFAILLATLPERNFEFVLVTIAFFAAYAELGRAHSLGYRGWIKKLAKILHAIIIRPLELGDKSSLHTLRLVLKTPLRFRSIVMTERSRRVPDRDQMPSQPLFHKQVGVPAYYQLDAYRTSHDQSGSESWSRCATEGGDTEPASDASDVEQCLSEDVTNQDYDSEEFDIKESEPIQSQAYMIQDNDRLSADNVIDHTVDRYKSRTETDEVQIHPGLFESRLVRGHDTLVERKCAVERDITTKRSELMKQEPSIEPDKPATNGPFMPRMWALSLPGAVDVAGHDIKGMILTIQGRKIPFSGRVPIVVAKCVEKISCNESEAEDTAPYCLRAGRYPSNPENFAQLKEAFNEPPFYGAEIDWSKYTAADATHVLFDYLLSLPEPLIPSDLSCKLPSLDNYIQKKYVPSDWSFLQVYAICMKRVPELSRHLLLIVIALLASQVELAERNHCNDPDGFYNEAARYCYPILSHPLDYRLATFTLLIVNARYFLGFANGQPPSPAEWNKLIEARTELAREEETDDLPRETLQLVEALSMVDPRQEATDMASPSIIEEQLQEQEQDSTHDMGQDYARQNENEDYRSNGDGLGHTHNSVVEVDVSEVGHGVQSLSLDDMEAALNEVVKSPEQGWTREPVEHEDTKPVDKVDAHTVAIEDKVDEEFCHLDAETPHLTPPQPPPYEPEVEPEQPSVVPSLPIQDAEEPRHHDWNTGKQDTREHNDVVEPAPSISQTTPQESAVVEDPAETDWRQYLDGVSKPPTPKLGTQLSHTGLQRLNIISTDDAVIVENLSHKWQQPERVPTAELQPEQPEPDRADDAEADDPVLVKRHHRRSGETRISFANEGRPRSAAGEFVNSERRRNNKEEGQQHGKKEHRKPTGLFGKPQKGFRKWVHGINN